MKTKTQEQLLNEFDGRGSDAERNAFKELKGRHGKDLPRLFLSLYGEAKDWRIRASYVFYSLEFCRQSTHAVELAKVAVTDRSKVVRYRACMLLACSLNAEVILFLTAALKSSKGETRGDIAAAIDAIKNQNQNYFVDRNHSGMTTLNIILL